MALTLYIFRHAKAAQADGLDDIARPLTDRGMREAAAVAALLSARRYQPDRILCSSSQRTRQTLAPLLPILAANVSIDVTRRIYDADQGALLDLIGEQSGVPSLMLIGHNPGLEQLARGLAGSGDKHALVALHSGFPPGALAVMSFDAVAWTDIAPGSGRLLAFHVPSVRHE
jgi:phosphohistidine phosphatase